MTHLRRRRRVPALAVFSAVACAATVLAAPAAGSAETVTTATKARSFSWHLTPTGTDSGLRGLDSVTRDVAWASGSGGTVLRTVDGGKTWRNVAPRGAAKEELAFRDVEAFSRNHAVLLAIGPGEASRIYKTSDGGRSWRETFRNKDERAFYDCMTFFNRRHGLAMSDPVNGKFRILRTDDFGLHWRVMPRRGMPRALPNEYGFAASGTCLVRFGKYNAWFATGGDDTARVFHSRDRGRTWTVAPTPMKSSESAGIFSLAFRTKKIGIAVGGDFLAPEEAVDALARTMDRGRSWRLVDESKAPGGYRSGSAWLRANSRTAIVVGPTGSDVSTDGGRSWRRFDTGSFDAVDCNRWGACWASGQEGRAARLVVR